MRVRLVTSLREFDALAPTWRAITHASGQISPFLSHDWFACCWRAAGQNRRREVWLLEDSAGPLAVIPLVRSKVWLRGLPVRVIEFLDSPDTPFVDFPVARGLEEVIVSFLNSLRAREDWDVFSIARLPYHSMTLKALEAALPGLFPWNISARSLAPYLTISGTWDDFWQERTERFRDVCSDLEARIQGQGEVALEHHRTVDPDGPAFAEIKELFEQSVTGSPDAITTTMPRMLRFFRELTLRSSANGWLHVWILRLAGRAIATEYQLGADGYLHTLRSDCDSSLTELAPQAYLRLRIIRSLFEDRHVHQYHPPPERHPDDLRCTTDTQEAVGLRVFAPSPYGRLLHRIETRLVPLARSWRSSRNERCA